MNKLFIIACIIFISVSALAQVSIIVNPNVEKNTFSVLEDNTKNEKSSMKVRYQLHSADFEEIETPKGKFVRMTTEGVFHNIRRLGTPQEMIVNKVIEAPINATVKVKITKKVENEYTLADYGAKFPVYPVQASVSKQDKEIPFYYKDGAYKKGYAKHDAVNVRELGTLRSHRLFLVQMKVSDYSPRTGKAKFCEELEFEIIFENADLEETKKIKKRLASPPIDAVCRSIIVNPGTAVRKGALKYVIVADPKFRGALQKFTDYKASKGVKSVVLFTDKIGTSKENIVAAIKNEYKNPADGIVPTFLLLVGDYQEIPGWDGKEGSYKTDLYYATMDGKDDFIPDMLAGRMSARTVSQLTAQIDKTIAYEKGDLPSYDFLRRSLLVAGWDSYWAEKRGYPHIRYALAYYVTGQNGHKDINQLTFLSSGSQQNVPNIHREVSKGVGFFNYTAHGTEFSFHDPEFLKKDIDALTNANMYPVVIGNCCLTGAFDEDECFAEKWLRVANKGAVTFIGGSSFTYWDEDLWWGTGKCKFTQDIENGKHPERKDTGKGALDTGFQKLQNFCNAGVMLSGNLAVQEADSYLTKYYFEVYHLFGDPGLPAYWATPNNPPKNR